jgi:hypothetical protein
LAVGVDEGHTLWPDYYIVCSHGYKGPTGQRQYLSDPMSTIYNVLKQSGIEDLHSQSEKAIKMYYLIGPGEMASPWSCCFCVVLW